MRINGTCSFCGDTLKKNGECMTCRLSEIRKKYQDKYGEHYVSDQYLMQLEGKWGVDGNRKEDPVESRWDILDI